jgi:hypothetical protein
LVGAIVPQRDIARLGTQGLARVACIGVERQVRSKRVGRSQPDVLNPSSGNTRLAAVEGATARVGAEDLRIGDRIRLACPMFCTSEELV